VAAEVGRSLKAAGIKAVLTGGACATIYSGGEYQSEDLDLIIQDSSSRKKLDEALKGIGFSRRQDHYVHPNTDFFVEFPRGPLSLGDDVDIRPVEMRIGKIAIRALSPTDSCRDRLAAFFHWNDRQSLETAVAIAVRNPVNLRTIRAWAERESSRARLDEFLDALKSARRATGKKTLRNKRRTPK
jgi:uncharacterized protein YjiS (DUF1127 family)